jgi:hypothetical protein
MIHYHLYVYVVIFIALTISNDILLKKKSRSQTDRQQGPLSSTQQ